MMNRFGLHWTKSQDSKRKRKNNASDRRRRDTAYDGRRRMRYLARIDEFMKSWIEKPDWCSTDQRVIESVEWIADNAEAVLLGIPCTTSATYMQTLSMLVKSLKLEANGVACGGQPIDGFLVATMKHSKNGRCIRLCMSETLAAAIVRYVNWRRSLCESYMDGLVFSSIKGSSYHSLSRLIQRTEIHIPAGIKNLPRLTLLRSAYVSCSILVLTALKRDLSDKKKIIEQTCLLRGHSMAVAEGSYSYFSDVVAIRMACNLLSEMITETDGYATLADYTEGKLQAEDGKVDEGGAVEDGREGLDEDGDGEKKEEEIDGRRLRRDVIDTLPGISIDDPLLPRLLALKPLAELLEKRMNDPTNEEIRDLYEEEADKVDLYARFPMDVLDLASRYLTGNLAFGVRLITDIPLVGRGLVADRMIPPKTVCLAYYGTTRSSEETLTPEADMYAVLLNKDTVCDGYAMAAVAEDEPHRRWFGNLANYCPDRRHINIRPVIKYILTRKIMFFESVKKIEPNDPLIWDYYVGRDKRYSKGSYGCACLK